jgi:2,3-dihydroxybiphenyl 1,2-dioxygenase
MAITGLAYTGLGVSDVDAWARFAVGVLGMQDAGTGEQDRRLLRMDDRSWRIELSPSGTNDIVFAGFEAANEQAMSDTVRDLVEFGSVVRSMTGEELARRGVQEGIVVEDPDGLTIEIVRGMQCSSETFCSPTKASFLTGPEGMGHLVVSTSDLEQSVRFYQCLGLAISDYIVTDLGPARDVRLTFLHCNARHHSVALLPLPTPKRLNHLMLEVTSVDALLGAYYKAQETGVPILRHLGRHTNDRMLSFYARTPAGFDVEYGYDGVRIEPGWKVRTYDAISIWGHASSQTTSR